MARMKWTKCAVEASYLIDTASPNKWLIGARCTLKAHLSDGRRWSHQVRSGRPAVCSCQLCVCWACRIESVTNSNENIILRLLFFVRFEPEEREAVHRVTWRTTRRAARKCRPANRITAHLHRNNISPELLSDCWRPSTPLSPEMHYSCVHGRTRPVPTFVAQQQTKKRRPSLNFHKNIKCQWPCVRW